MKKRLPFTWVLFLKNSEVYYLCFLRTITYSVSYFFFLYRLPCYVIRVGSLILVELRDLIDSILILIISNNFTQILNVLAQIPKCGSCSLALLDVFQFSFPGFYFAGNFPHFGKCLHISTRVSYNFSSNLGLGSCWNWCTSLSSYVVG